MLTIPHVTAESFKAHPTFLDLLNLRSGNTNPADQLDELNNILLMASAMADNAAELGTGATLAAHTRVESRRMRPNRYGQLVFTADHFPVVAVQSLAYGSRIGQLTTIANPSVWIEDGRRIIADLQAAGSTSWSGSLQFGAPAANRELYSSWTLTSGYVSTSLANVATAGATSIVVGNPLGITVGAELRVWDPGNEETLVIDASYTGGTTVPLASPLTNAHAPNVGVSGFPADVHLAVIMYACALLQRPDSEKEDTYPSARVRPNTKVSAGKDGSGFVAEADHLMAIYRRTVGF